MSITAYASAEPAPTANQWDHLIDQSNGDVFPPVAPTLTFYGDVIDTINGAGPFSYKWSIISKPYGSAASLVNDTLQDVELTGIDLEGNYVLFLVVTNTASTEVSEGSYVVAPNSARSHLRVRTTKHGLEKNAPVERNVYKRPINSGGDTLRNVHDIVDAFENHTIEDDHNTVATGADLDELVGGGMTALHQHAGLSVTPATEIDLGTVMLEDAPVDPLHPKVINQERLIFQGGSAGTMTSRGFKPGIIEPPVSTVAQACWWVRVPEDVTVDLIEVGLEDGGGVPGDYQFAPIYTATVNGVEANTWFQLLDTDAVWRRMQILWDDAGAHASSVAHGPLQLRLKGDNTAPTYKPWEVTGGWYIGIQCIAAPAEPGGGLHISIHARRKV